jgi:DNA replication licensing factor MCM2
MSDNEETPQRKRRRTIQDDDDSEDGGGAAAGDDNASASASASASDTAGETAGDTETAGDGGGGLQEPDSPPSQARNANARAQLLERRSAERRQRRRQAAIQNEVADLNANLIGDAGEFEPVAAETPPQSDVDDEEDHDADYDVNGNGNDNDNYNPEEEEDGEDLLENAERDYQRIEALDTYGTEGMDNRDYGAMDMDTRRAAESELAGRDRQTGRGGRNAGLYDQALDIEDDEDEEARATRRGNFRPEGGEEVSDDETDEEDLDAEDTINIEAFDVPLREWITQDRTRREIQRKFRVFLRHFTEESMTVDPAQRRKKKNPNGLYEQKIRAMCASNLSTLQVSYLHLMESEPVLAVWLVDAPKDMLEVLNEAATRHTLMLFNAYNAIKKEIHVRISDVPIMDSLRDLRRSHLDCLVKVLGVITRRGTVYPSLQLAHYRCLSCKSTQGPFRVEEEGENVVRTYEPDECPVCEGTMFKLDPSLSQYRNFQKVNLQETPGSVPPGRVPRTKEILFTNDLIDVARPGEEVEVTGIYEQKYDSSLTLKSGFPVFSTFLTANHVSKREDASSASNLSENDIRKILELARDPRIGERIVQSIAPSIFGHENTKMALAMALFGGVAKNINDKHRIRGDVNVLLLGDPGTAKSQLLKYAEYTAPRAVYSTGKGASAVGLTAGVHKDPITKEWTLEGGALVLADKGVCLIDEFDKSKFLDFFFTLSVFRVVQNYI